MYIIIDGPFPWMEEVRCTKQLYTDILKKKTRSFFTCDASSRENNLLIFTASCEVLLSANFRNRNIQPEKLWSNCQENFQWNTQASLQRSWLRKQKPSCFELTKDKWSAEVQIVKETWKLALYNLFVGAKTLNISNRSEVPLRGYKFE